MNLYKHTEELAALMRLFDGATDPETGEISVQDSDTLEAWASEVEAGFDAKLEAVESYRRNLMAEAVALKAEEDRMERRRKALERRGDAFAAYIASALTLAGKDKAKAGTFSFSFRNSEAVVLSDGATLDTVPLRFVRIEERKTLDKVAAKAALKAGEELPGLSLEVRRNLVVR